MRKALGSKQGTPTKRGTWGGSYQIEIKTRPSTVSCYTCTNCVDESKSCRHYGMFIPVLGKNSWRSCKNFKLDLSYANNENISYVNKVKGHGYIQQEHKPTPVTELNNKHAHYNQKHHKNEVVEQKEFPSFLMENIVLLCLKKHLNPIDILKSAFNRLEKDQMNDVKFDQIIQSTLNNYLIDFKEDYDTLSKLVYQLSKQLNCSMVSLLSLNNNEKEEIAKEFMSDEHYDTKKLFEGSEQYYLLPDNLTKDECMELCFLNDYYYWDKGTNFPIFGESIDEAQDDENGHTIYEDCRYILYFNSIGQFDDKYPFDLEYAFPIYFQQEYMHYNKNIDVCSNCNKSFSNINDYFSEDDYHTWKCPNCSTINDIYDNYFFKKIYLPKDDEYNN